MGLTIHYQFAAGKCRLATARGLVAKLRAKALALPFAHVTDIVELQGDACVFDPANRNDPQAWLKIQTVRYLQPEDSDRAFAGEVAPLHIIAFTIGTVQGAEPANIGLCRYPPTTLVNGNPTPTGVHGWAWSSCCKTQYASNPSLGGMENFLKAHLSLVALLDYAKSLGVIESVYDEGKYWENRDPAALVKEVGRWNAMVAGVYGTIRDNIESRGGAPESLQTPITEFPNFEHLEAEGRKDKSEDN